MKKSAALTLVCSLLLASCGDFFSPDWGTPAREFFKEYTESAAIMQPRTTRCSLTMSLKTPRLQERLEPITPLCRTPMTNQ